MKVSALGIKGKKSFLIKKDSLPEYNQFRLNGDIISDAQKNHGFIFKDRDKFEYVESRDILIDYRKGDESISIEEYKSKPQRYTEDDSEECVLRALANRKELEGFKPYYEKPTPNAVELNINGWIEDTGSVFIGCFITGRYSKNSVLYTTSGSIIAMDEYNILREKYSNHAKFQSPDRSYLRFTKINGEYAFGEYKPFGDSEYANAFSCLEDAKKEEKEIRDAVRRVVEKSVFRENNTDHKNIQVLSQLKAMKKLKSKKSMDELLTVIIGDLTEYVSKIS